MFATIARLVLVSVVVLAVPPGIERAAAHELFTDRKSKGVPPRPDAVARLLPPGVSSAASRRTRSVIRRSLLWRNGQTLVVCFLDGTNIARQRIIEVASEWPIYVNLKLDFGAVEAPRTCSGTNSEDIKVGFKDDARDGGYWSLVGTQSRQLAHSLNLEGFGEDALPPIVLDPADPARTAESFFHRIVLHEFGHALGFEHEHQSPEAHCDDQIDWPAAYRVFARIGWTEADVNLNLRQITAPDTEAARYDKKSVMHYRLPPEILRGGEASVCFAKETYVLSDGDQGFAKIVYPIPEPPPVAVASAETTTPARRATRGVRSAAAPGSSAELTESRDQLVRDYRAAIRESGVPDNQIEGYVARFRAHLATQAGVGRVR